MTAGRRNPLFKPSQISQQGFSTARRAVAQLFEAAEAAYGSLPAPHAATHLQGASDPLTAPAAPSDVQAGVDADAGVGPGYALEDHVHHLETGVPADLGAAAAEGSGTAVARAGHVHKRAIEVLKAAALIGVRRMLNFIDSASVTVAVVDNAGFDRIDVTLTATGAGLAANTPQYLTLVADGGLTNERVLTPDGAGLQGADGGAGAAYTLSLKDVLRGTKALTNATDTGLFKVAVPSGGHAAGRVLVTVQIDDGTDFECYSAWVTYAAVNKAGTLTMAETAAGASSAFSTGAGIAMAFTPVTGPGANEFSFRVNATSGLGAPSTLNCKFQAYDETGRALTAL